MASQSGNIEPQLLQCVEDTSRDFVVDEPAQAKQHGGTPRETDERRLEQRQKQVDLGKNTIAYQRYAEQVPKWKRRRVGFSKPPYDPTTPDPHRVCSKRAFDGEVRAWRRALHRWDDAVGEDEEIVDIKARLTISSNPAQPLKPSCQANTHPAEAPSRPEEAIQPGGPSAKQSPTAQPQENRNAKRPAAAAPWRQEPSPRRRLNGPKGSFANVVASQAAMASPAPSWATEVAMRW
ncbi:hypothetical protein WJX84_010169 [Apatococcus fuscideae]|uniref:Histone RNA hairpin-binding protein RNA-binding domain-containing protein n=1 Tax=Apatococcus fuscideae TaxID=2026836 RepID=A0AAW1SNT2_9CHLO